jgi:hypothetical protein
VAVDKYKNRSASKPRSRAEQIAHRANFAHIGKAKQNAFCRGNKPAMN